MKSSSEPHHWPYLHESQAGWLDPDRITEQGRFLLYRALNLRQIVAFLGAGTSMAYGRISWSELAYKQATRIISFYNTECKTDKNFTDSRQAENIDKIVKILMDQKEKYDAGADIDQVFCLNICEQFMRIIGRDRVDRLAEILGIGKNFSKISKPIVSEDYGRACFQLSIKHETFDERRNIQSILQGKFTPSANDLFASLPTTGTPADWASLATTKLSDFSELDRINLPGSRQSAAFFQGDAIARQAQALADEAAKRDGDWPLAQASRIYAALRQKTVSQPLPPACYFMVGLALDLLRYQDAVTGDKEAVGTWLRALVQVPPKETLSRGQVIPKLCDPLYCLIQDLKIDRIATVNYDLEVERFLADAGYGVQPVVPAAGFASYERAGPLGARTRDIALDGDRAADLIDFAVSEDEYTVQVAHLHGRATADSDLVVTERDYRNSYIHNGDVSDIYRQGLSILFGGNPVLFIGVGLNEEDLLRPLREFLSLEPDSNRPVLALMPALSSERDCRATTIKHFARYGIYVLHHGLWGTTDWLHQIDSLCKSICGILKDAKSDSPPAGLKRRRRKAQAELSRLDMLSFKPLDDSLEEDAVDLRLELEAIGCILDVMGQLLDKSAPHREEMLEALRNWTFSVVSAVLTKSLCGALLGTRKSWDKWWEHWKKIPDARHKSLPFTNLPYQQPDRNPVPPVIVRHYSVGPMRRAAPGTAYIDDPISAFIINTINAGANSPSTLPAGSGPPANTEPAPDWCREQQVVLISGDKGAGKGLLFASLLDWIDKTRPISHAGFFFAGFSFSCEVASVWDALITFIDPSLRPQGVRVQAQGRDGATAAPLSTQRGGETGVVSAPVSQSRAARLTEALKRVKAAGQRLLIVMNSIDMLFHRNGEAKNAEIHSIMQVLFGADAAPVLDIIILVRKDRCPQFLLAQDAARKSPVKRYKQSIRPLVFDEVTPLPWGHDVPMREIGGAAGTGDSLALTISLKKPRDRSNIHFKLEMPKPPNNTARMSLYSRYMLHMIDLNNRNTPNDKDRLLSSLETGRLGQSYSLMKVFDAVTDYWYFNKIDEKRLSDCVSDFDKILLDEIKIAERTVSDKKNELDERVFQDFPTLPEKELAASAHLHEALIRHLAVISIPVPAIVLADCPAIQQIYDERRDPEFNGQDRHWHAQRLHLLVALALHIMVQLKGMVFCIDPVDTDSVGSRKHSLPRRYQVHRGLQHFVYNRLGAQVVEPVEGIFFTPSLPTSQARSMPQLNADAYIFLYDLVHKLSGYPSANTNGPGSRAGVMAFNLRAAMGVVRTLLSFGTVCRFANLQSLPALGQGGIGQLERHRLLLRWMLVAATRCPDVRGVPDKNPADPSDTKPEGKPAPPFYQDETAWLLNEIGVLSLIQGRCREADTFVSLALNTSIVAEGFEGTMSRRMKLNRGLCAIDLGRLTVARHCFDEVRYQDDEELLLRTLAEGYTAQVEHLCGNYVLAEKQYAEAIRNLRKLDHRRPVSYLRRAEADLFRRVGRNDDAKQALEESLRIAEAGGFNDYYHFSQLSEVRLNLATSAQLVDLLPTVDQAERYADRMDMPRLKIEALRTRAEVFLSQGETRLAGEMAAGAMRLAKLNDLVLRRISLTELLSRIFRRRGNLLAADRMQALAERSARRVGYHMPGSKPW